MYTGESAGLSFEDKHTQVRHARLHCASFTIHRFGWMAACNNGDVFIAAFAYLQAVMSRYEGFIADDVGGKEAPAAAGSSSKQPPKK